MKTLLASVAVFAFALLSVNAFAQYGNGGGSYNPGISNGGGIFALLRDYCPNGDTSSSYYDNSCGNGINPGIFGNLLVTGPGGTGDNLINQLTQFIRKRRVSFTRFFQIPGRPFNRLYKRKVMHINTNTGSVMSGALMSGDVMSGTSTN